MTVNSGAVARSLARPRWASLGETRAAIRLCAAGGGWGATFLIGTPYDEAKMPAYALIQARSTLTLARPCGIVKILLSRRWVSRFFLPRYSKQGRSCRKSENADMRVRAPQASPPNPRHPPLAGSRPRRLRWSYERERRIPIPYSRARRGGSAANVSNCLKTSHFVSFPSQNALISASNCLMPKTS